MPDTSPIEGMATPMDSPKGFLSSFAFGPFEADLASGELRKDGARVKIQDLPLRLMSLLAEKPGQVLTREELQSRLWPEHTFVDFEDGLNTGVKKLREALGDDPEKPRYIETIPRRGYRFIAEVKQMPAAARVAVSAGELPTPLAVHKPTAGLRVPRSRLKAWMLGAVTAVALLIGLTFWLLYGRPAFSFNERESVLVTDFENQTGDTRFDEALRTAFIVSLEQSRHANVFPQIRVGTVLKLMGKSSTEHVTPTLGREICQRENIRGLIVGSITRTGQEYALSAQLIDPQTGVTVRSYMERSYGEDHVLDALDVIAAHIRRDLGESLYQIHRADRPLPEVTTSSLTALKQYADSAALWHQGRFQDAVTLMRAAIQTAPDFAMAHAALGNAYFSYIVNAPVEGKQEYEKALALASRTTDRERLLIQVNYEDDLGHVSEADALYRAYLGRYPDDWTTLCSYARLLRRHGRAPEAIAQYKEIVRVAPDDARTYVEMATAYKTLNQLPQALAAYAEAIRLDPEWLAAGDVGREYGFALVVNGEDQKAEQVFSAMLEKPATRESGMRSLAILDMYHGHYLSAGKRFEDCLAILQNQQAVLSTARVHLWLAILADGHGNLPAERQQLDYTFDNFAAIEPKVIFGPRVGRQYVSAGAVEKAEKLEGLIAPLADPKNSEQTGSLHLLQGEIALARGHADQAIELFTLSNAENSTPFSVEALASAYQQAGKTDDAIAWYEKLMGLRYRALGWETQQLWLAAHATLASDYASKGEREKAKQTLGFLLDMWKDADPDLPLLKQAKSEYAKLQ